MRAGLLKQLRMIPQFNSFEKAVKENLVLSNSYVEDFAPEREGFEYDKYENRSHKYRLSNDQIEEIAIDRLLGDNKGSFEEFIHENDLRGPITELVRILIDDIRREGWA